MTSYRNNLMRFPMKARILAVLASAVLVACGGGGGGGSAPTTPTVPATPAPTVTLSLAQTKASVGTAVALNWSSTNATSCTGSDGLSGSQLTSGSTSVTPSAGGQVKYTITCTGAGGSAAASATLTVPMPVLATSYLNAKTTNVGPQTMPRSTAFIKDEAITAGHQYGDFFQEGEYSMLAASNVFAGVNGFGSTVAGKIYFFKKINGVWTDRTSDLLADQTGCISPRKVVVADFNGDGKPDAFISCHGIDGNLPPGATSGERPRFIMSRSDGKYDNKLADFSCYCHGATAADFSGKGYADLVIADPVVFGRSVYLTNNQNGTWTDSPEKLPMVVRKTIFSVEFVDANGDGKQDLALLGAAAVQPASWQFPGRVVLNDGTNNFDATKSALMFPVDQFGETEAVDIIVKDSKIYLLKAVYQGTNPIASLYVMSYSVPTMSTVFNAKVAEDKDTLWFTIFGGKVVGAFTSNPYTVD